MVNYHNAGEKIFPIIDAINELEVDRKIFFRPGEIDIEKKKKRKECMDDILWNILFEKDEEEEVLCMLNFNT